ncbi:MAG TPA: hypothetical protein VN922_02465 [Bacteroidia bacterium]|nr:hypothetical protein [Bacteroidia bacterium]
MKGTEILNKIMPDYIKLQSDFKELIKQFETQHQCVVILQQDNNEFKGVKFYCQTNAEDHQG